MKFNNKKLFFCLLLLTSITTCNTVEARLWREIRRLFGHDKRRGHQCTPQLEVACGKKATIAKLNAQIKGLEKEILPQIKDPKVFGKKISKLKKKLRKNRKQQSKYKRRLFKRKKRKQLLKTQKRLKKLKRKWENASQWKKELNSLTSQIRHQENELRCKTPKCCQNHALRFKELQSKKLQTLLERKIEILKKFKAILP